jgi:HEPN domain-containing protein
VALTWRPVSAAKLDALPVPERFLALADAYLDSALRLCTVLERSPRKTTYGRGAVVLYLAHHSAELFLKGMIRRREPKASIGHDLGRLSGQYHGLYPEQSFLLELPFTVHTNARGEEARALVQTQVRTRTERLRYPIDRAGNPWPGERAFEAGSFKRSLLALRASFARISQHGGQGA